MRDAAVPARPPPAVAPRPRRQERRTVMPPDHRVSVTLARAAMRALPPPVVARGGALLLRRLGRVHPRLFADLARLAPASVGVAPTDLPHRFRLEIGGGRPPRLALAQAADLPPDAAIEGSLESLIDLLEGRIDGDALFFSRAITVTGDSAAVVGLRNTLDRYPIDVLEAATGLLGPLAGPARRIGQRLERLGEGLRGRLVATHASLHAAAPTAAQDPAAEIATLRGEVRRLATRLARLERRGAPVTEDHPA